METFHTQDAWNAASDNARGFRDLTVQQVKSLRGITLVDVREPHEFSAELGHIADARLVPLATVAAAASGWDRHQEVVMVCRSGGRSGNAAGMLCSMGFTRVMNMVGGMLAWNAAGFPVVKQV